MSKFAPGATTPSATLTGVSFAQALAFDASDNLFVANYSANTVSKFSPTVPATTSVTIQSSVESRPMLIGGTNSNPVAGINLTSAELARIFTTSTGTITIGDASQTGNITLATATPATTSGAAIVLVQSSTGAGQIILDDGSGSGTALSGNSGAVSLTAGTGGIVEQSTDTAGTADIGNATTVSLTSAGPISTSSQPLQLASTTLTTDTAANNSNQFLSALGTVTATSLDAGSGTVMLAAGNFGFNIDGTTAGTQYTQLNVSGTLDLAGASLQLSGAYVPVGAHTFTIVSATSVTGTFAGLADGSIVDLNGAPLTVHYTATTVTLTSPATTYGDGLDASGVLTITQEIAAANDNLNFALSGGTYTFTDTGGLTFDNPGGADAADISGAGTSTLTVPSADVTSIAVVLGTGTNVFNFTGTNGASAAPISVNTGTTTGDEANVTGAVLDSGAVALTSASIAVSAGLSAGGNLTLLANTAGTATGNFVGINVYNDATVQSTAGNVSLEGTGGNDPGGGDSEPGVVVGSTVQATSATGTVTIRGTGGTSSGNGSYGVDVEGTVTSGGGNVSVAGTGGASAVSVDFGVLIGGTVTAAGSGTVTVQGTGGASSNEAMGVAVQGGSINSGGGNVLVTGQGGGGSSSSSANNFGVLVQNDATVSRGQRHGHRAGHRWRFLWVGGQQLRRRSVGPKCKPPRDSDLERRRCLGHRHRRRGAGGNNIGVLVSEVATITSGGTASVTVQGTSGGGSNGTSYGVQVVGGNSQLIPQITSSGGNVQVTGTGSTTSVGVEIDSYSTLSSGGSGSLTITTDSLDIGSGNLVTIEAGASGTGTATIQTRTAGTLINLGGSNVLTGSPLTLGLNVLDLELLTAGTLNIGNTSSGTITVSADIGSTATAVALISGGDIVISGGQIESDGTLLLQPGASGSVQPTHAGTDATVSTLSIASNLTVNIAGTTVDTQYTQLNVAGTVDLTGVHLLLTGNYVPVGGNVFTIVSATDITGTFAGLANGSTVVLNGVTLTVHYTATTVTLVNTDIWVNTGSGSWDTGANWSSGNVPSAGDDVIINTTGAATVTIQSGDTISINSLTTGGLDTLAITDGALAVAADSTLSGPLTMTGGSLTAAGAGVTVQANGTTAVSAASVFAQAGATLSLPNLASYAGAVGDIDTLEATGTGSTLTLAHLASIACDTSNVFSFLQIEALAGATVALPALTTISGGPVALESDGTSSVLNVSALTSFTGAATIFQAPALQATNHGTLDNGGLTALDGVNVTIDGTGTWAYSQITSYTDGVFTMTGGTLNLPTWAAIDGSSFDISGGAALSLPTPTSYAGAAGIYATFIATGAGSTLTFARLASIAADTTSVHSFVQFQALAGATVALPALTTISGGPVALESDGNNSVLDVAALTSFTGAATVYQAPALQATNQGTLENGGLTSLTGVNVTIDGTGTWAYSQITSYTDGVFTMTGGTLSLPTWADIDGSSFDVSGGAALSLPTPTRYAGAAGAYATLIATGADSTLTLADLACIAADTTSVHSNLQVQALAGGQIALPALTTITGGPVVLESDGDGSVLNVSALTSFSGSSTSYQLPTIQATNDGTIQSGSLTTLAGVSVIVDSTANWSASSVTSATGGTITVNGLVPSSGSGVTIDVPQFPAGLQALPIQLETGTLTGTTISVPADEIVYFEGGTFNGGTVLNLAAGAVAEMGDSSFAGGVTFNLGQGASANLVPAGTVYYSGTLSGTGNGTVLLAGGDLDVTTGGLTLNFPGSIFQWTGGTIEADSGNVSNLGTINIAGSATKVLYVDGTFTNDGTIVQSGTGDLRLNSDSGTPTTLAIAAGGSYLLESDAGLDNGNGTNGVTNAGTIRKVAGSGTSTLAFPGVLTNTGTIEADSGTLDLEPGSFTQLSGNALTGGTWNALDGAKLKISSSATLTSSAGNIAVDGANAAITGLNYTDLASNSGSLSLTDGASFTAAADFTNSGSLTLGAGSTLTVPGTFTQTAAGTLNEQLGGTPASGQFGQIAAGTATLNGTFDLSLIDGLSPSAGQDFPVLTYTHTSGAFGSFNGVAPFFTVSAGPASFDLVIKTDTWINAGSGSWDNAANWSSGSVPDSSDDVVIDTAANATITIAANDFAKGITTAATDTLAIASGSLTVAGASVLSGGLSMDNGTSLTVSGSGITFTVAGTTGIDGASVFAEGGATLSLPALTSYTGAAGATTTLEATGTGSTLSLANMTSLTAASGYGAVTQVEAFSAGTVDLAALSTISGGAAYLESEGNGSVLDVPALTSFANNGAYPSQLAVTNHGTVNGDSYSAAVLAAGPIGYYAFNETSGTTAADVSGLGNNGVIGSGVQLGVAGAPIPDGGTAFQFNGGNVALNLPQINTTADQANTVTFWMYWDGTDGVMPISLGDYYDLQFYAGSFGFNTFNHDLRGISSTGLANRWVHVAAEFFNGDATLNRLWLDGVEQNLTQLFGAPASLTASSTVYIGGPSGFDFSGRIDEPAIYDRALSNTEVQTIFNSCGVTSLQYVNLTLDGTGTVALSQLTSYTDGTLSLSGGTLTLNNLTDIDGASFMVSGGAALSLPGATSYAGAAGATTTLEATGTGSTLSLANMTSLTAATGYGAVTQVEALSGGTVDLAALSTISGGAAALDSDGSDSVLDLSALTSFANSDGEYPSELDVTNDGTVTGATGVTNLAYVNLVLDGTGTWSSSQLTSFTDGTLSLSGGTLTLGNVTDIDGASFIVSGGAALCLPGAASYAGTTGATTTLEATGTGSRLSLANLTSLTAASGYGAVTQVEALSGGTVDLSALPTISGGAVELVSDGSDSVLDMAVLASFTNNDGEYPSELDVTNHGTVTGATGVTSLTYVNLALDGTGTWASSQILTYTDGTLTLTGGAFALSGATDIDGSSFVASGGATLSLPAARRYAGTAGATTTLEATGTGSTLALAILTSLTAATGFGAVTQVEALSGGTVDLAMLPTISGGAVDLESDGSESVLDLPALATFSAAAVGGIAVGDGGTVTVGSNPFTMPAAGNAVTVNVPQWPAGLALPLLLASSGNFTGGTTFNVAAGQTVDITAGTYAGGAVFNVGPGASINLTAGGTITYSGTLTGSGTGSVLVNQGVLDVGAAGLTLNFPGTLFQCVNVTFAGNGATVANLGTINFTGAATVAANAGRVRQLRHHRPDGRRCGAGERQRYTDHREQRGRRAFLAGLGFRHHERQRQ